MAIMDGSVFSVCRPFFAFVTSIALRYPIKKWSAIATEIATFAYLLIPVDAPKSLQCRIPIVVCSRRWIDCGLRGHSSEPTPSAKAWPEPQRVRRTNRHHSDRLDVHVRHDRHNSCCRCRNRPFAAFHFYTGQLYSVITKMLPIPVSNLVVMPVALMGFIVIPLGVEAIPYLRCVMA
jgi:hypothetical protein